MRIYLGVGHGVRQNGVYDPGASGGGWTEQSAGDQVVAAAARYLLAMGAEVRSEAFANDPNHSGTAVLANAWPADIVVEIHHDWAGAPLGAFGHWYGPASKALADAIQLAVGDAGFHLRPSWHRRRTDLSILKATDMPCVLYECGRIGQRTLDTQAELQSIGRAIGRGISTHLGLRRAPAPAPPPMQPPTPTPAPAPATTPTTTPTPVQPPKPEVPDMTADQEKTLGQLRISSIADGFDEQVINIRLTAIMEKLGIVDPPKVAEVLKARGVAVAQERARLA